MPDDPQKRRPQDSSRVNIHEQWELEYSSQHFGVTPERLRQAVQAVGPMVNDVRQRLRK